MAEPARDPDAVALVVGGAGPAALRRTLTSLALSPRQLWCAVPSAREAAAAAGLARAVVVEPWPGRAAALPQLYELVAPELDNQVVLVLTSGMTAGRELLRRTAETLAGGAGVAIGVPRRDARRVRRGLLPHAVLRPGAGMAIGARTLAQLASKGWLADGECTVRQIEQMAGPVVTVSGALHHALPPADAPVPRSQRPTVTVLIPAHNEEAWIGDTVRSVHAQTFRPDELIVVDDCSTDRTGEVARSAGATVLRTPTNRLKAGAQNYALARITTDVIVTLDADTVLHADAVDHLVRDIEAGVDATHGAVLPRNERGLWARSRVVEYAMAIRLHKWAQRSLGNVLVLSGCAAAFRTDVLRAIGGFHERSIVEDMDLTWMLHMRGYAVGYAPKAVAYPVEPTSFRLYKAQMRRWARGFFQVVSLHRRSLPRRPGLALIVGASVWDLVSSALLVVMTPLILLVGLARVSPTLLGVWALLALVVPLVLTASVVGARRAAIAVPIYLGVVLVAQYLYMEALVREWVLRRSQRTWGRGH